jgi:hypothetical protein
LTTTRDRVVFVGPSARTADRPPSRGIEWRPPIRRGDLALLPSRVRQVGIVDGEFDQSLAVAPREIIDLLRRGVEVVGASSMGALRAVELRGFGMRGVGRIFEMYRDEEVEADDEVAIVFDPDTLRPLTEPLVNVRCAVAAAERAGRITAAVAETIVAAARALPYRARTYRRILADAGAALRRDVAALAPMLEQHDQKRLDALLLFRDLAAGARADR